MRIVNKLIKPFSESCEQNKAVILETIQPLLVSCHNLLEVGSGTGQHAIHFAQAMPHIQWFTSDRHDALNGIQMWVDEYRVDGQLNNLHAPVTLDVTQHDWPALTVDAVFTANTLHIMHWNEVQIFFKRGAQLLNDDGLMLVYGPFNYNGQFTSESNQRFEGWLKSRDPHSGIRDFSDLDELAKENGLTLLADYEMPANNRILCWQKA